MITCLLIIATALLSVFLLYSYLTRDFNYWKVRKVNGPEPVPVFGNIQEYVFLRQTQGECLQNFYRKYMGEKFIGIFQLSTPTLLILDPQAIKQFLVKDFQYFTDRGFTYDEEKEPLTANLINLEGTKWKFLRQKLTGTFSSGKMKNMMNLLHECSDQLIVHLRNTIQNKPNKQIEMREFTAKFTTDVIGSCAFGLHFNCMSKDSSEFHRMGQLVIKPSPKNALSKLVRVLCPPLYKLLGLRTFPKEVNDFFISLVSNTLHHRQLNKIHRQDFLYLLAQIQKTEVVDKADDIELTDKLIAAQAFLFFVAGFETSSTTLSFCLHELALNPEIQEEVYLEIKNIAEEFGESFAYDNIKDLVLLEQCILETMRKYPPVQVLSRVCTKTYNLPDTNIVLRPGTPILIPVYAIHHDEKYYPEPEKFEPGRFTKENIRDREFGTYLPFGEGPRICIGMRFAMLEMKLALTSMLLRYRIKSCDKTQNPLPLDPAAFILAPKCGIWLEAIPRNSDFV